MCNISRLEDWSLLAYDTVSLGNHTDPVPQCQDLNTQQHCCQNLMFHIIKCIHVPRLFYKKRWYHYMMTFNKVIVICKKTSIQIGYHNKSITNTLYTKFLGVTVENTLVWNTHLYQLIIKWSKACYMTRTIKSVTLTDTLITMYHAYFHLLMSYGLIIWAHCPYSINIFWLQKKVIKIISSIRNSDSCTEYFKKN